ncbi:hypothetical protein [Paraburkholderia sp. SIMBA_054]|uniref:hypothetical protein n=1 Tax=Paraburkholderia sp. SIMBA_054 TaxID=3085795 RepID=UPI003979B3C7
MSRIRRSATWAIRNLGLPTLMMAVGIAAAAVNQASEVPAQAYTIMSDNWSRLHPDTQRKISELMARRGRIDHWHYTDLFSAIINDAGGIVMPAPDGDQVAARQHLTAVIRGTGSTKDLL